MTKVQGGRKNSNKRVLDIYLRLEEGKTIYLEKEVERFRVSPRTIKRDIAEIRDCLADRSVLGDGTKKLVYDKELNGYKLQSIY